MKVAFNGTAMLPSQAGIGRYAREIALGLQRSADVEVDFMYGVRWSRSVPEAAMPGAKRFFPLVRDRLPGAFAARRIAQTASLELRRFRARFDLYHEPATIALPYRGPIVLTVHDLSWIRHPETQPAKRVKALDRYFESGLRKATMVLTPSAFVRQEVLQMFALDPAAIRATPLAADSDYRPMGPHETNEVLDRFGLVHGSYLLAVGTLEPRKNLLTTVEAFLQLPAAVRARHPLVVVGMRGWNASAVEQRLAPLVRRGEVKRLGYLSHVELVAVTAGACATAFPSLYEGFGLPPLEAMACGVPSVVSNESSLPEVVGDAGLQVDAMDSAALAVALLRLIEDPIERERLSHIGLKRAEGFRWPDCVAQTIAAYEEALRRA